MTIDLLARDDRTAFGLMTALAIERWAYRHVAQPADCTGEVVIVSRPDLGPEGLALVQGRPTVIVGEGGRLIDEIFGGGPRRRWHGPAELPLDTPVWPTSVRRCAGQYGATSLRLPSLVGWRTEGPPRGDVLATVRGDDGVMVPAVVVREQVCWVTVDLGAAFADLLDEGYRGPMSAPRRPFPRALLAAYYRVPGAVRRVVQQRAYRRLVARLATVNCPSTYPVDTAGWLVLGLLHALLRRTGVPLVRLARWPAPYRSAAALTHDLEPSRFAYAAGLERLRARVRAAGHPPTYGVVARAAAQMSVEARAAVATADVVCHGLEHRGETLIGTAVDVAAGLGRARTELQTTLRRPIAGFRSPRLDRSTPLLWALDRVGFAFDSSYPDVDRENLDGYGAGVRLNLPFRPPLAAAGGGVRASRCLELPVSAPDCIQPLFEGQSLKMLRRAVRQKVAFTHATRGLYVGIVHGGVFGPRDAARRGAHLGFVRRLLSAPDLWLASLSEIAQWWTAREQVTIDVRQGVVRLTNLGDRPLAGLVCVVERGMSEVVHRLAPLLPGIATPLPERAEGA